MILTYLVAFLAALAVDYCWARYTAAVAEHQRWIAGLWSIGIGACGGITTISFVTDHWLLIPVLAGYFTGTVLAVKEKS